MNKLINYSLPYKIKVLLLLLIVTDLSYFPIHSTYSSENITAIFYKPKKHMFESWSETIIIQSW